MPSGFDSLLAKVSCWFMFWGLNSVGETGEPTSL